ncbi:MBL fold metallo-hydrolase [Archangium violaceum]|uniref:MBL fold metallo-hydrolase n=1 Tax=Archangium violaceum TaxID=83451 RepID=UPI0037BF5E55
MADGRPSLLLRGLLVLGGLGMLAAGVAWKQVPRASEPRIEAAPEVVGLSDGQSYAWVMRTRNGAALIDTGADASGEKLLAELRQEGLKPEDVHTVLVTHGHRDHWSAAHLFPKARVLVGPGEAEVVRGERALHSLAGRFLARFTKQPPLPERLEEVEAGQTLDVDGESLRVFHVPGHTPGSVMYLWRDILFSGDSLLGGSGEVVLAPTVFSESTKENRKSLEQLKDVPFTRIADGHVGLTSNARLKLRALLK